MRQLSFSLFLCLFAISLLPAQVDYTTMKWGEVPEDDLRMEVYALDSTAEAVVLADEGVMYARRENGFELTLNRHRRIKILNEAGVKKYGDVTLYYYHKDGTDMIRQVEAQAIAPDGTVSKVDRKTIFRDEINENYTKVTFSFPNVQVGSVLEYRYNHDSEHFVTPDTWYFRDEIPVRYSYYRFVNEIPASYTYMLLGAEFMDFEATSENGGRYTLGDMSLELSQTEFLMRNGSAVKEEPYMTTLSDYRIMLRFQCSEYYSGNGLANDVLGSWESVADELSTHPNLGLKLKRKGRLKTIFDDFDTRLVAGMTETDKVYLVNRFVSEQMSWDGKHGIFTSDDLDRVYERKQGNIADIQYIGLALLEHLGLAAYPVLLSTRGNGAMIEQFPFVSQFNYVILLVIADGKVQLLDLSDPLLKPGMVRLRALNHKGFLLRTEEPGFIDLNLPVFRDVMTFNGQIKTDGSLSGEMKFTQSGFSARSDRSRLRESDAKTLWHDRFPDGSELSGIEIDKLDDVRENLRGMGEFTTTNTGFSNGDFLYISPSLCSSFQDNPFKRETRSYPIDFPYPFEEKTVYSYELPEGYTLESLPENLEIKLPNDAATYQFFAAESAGKLRLMHDIRVEHTYFRPAEYEALRDLFEQAAQKMQEQIVLRKL